MYQGVAADPEQQESQKVLLSDPHQSQPSLPHADSTAASAHLPGHTRHTRVGLWYVSPNVSLALDQGGRRGGQEGCKEVEQDAVLVGQTEDAGDET